MGSGGGRGGEGGYKDAEWMLRYLRSEGVGVYPVWERVLETFAEDDVVFRQVGGGWGLGSGG
jgi:hypothetical protein